MTMTAEEKSSVKNSVGRMIFVGLSVLVQAGWIVFLFLRLNQYSAIISLCSSLIALVVVLKLYSKHTSANLKMPWIILILVFPVAGLCLYFMIGRADVNRAMRKRYAGIDRILATKLPQNEQAEANLSKQDAFLAGNAKYVRQWGGWPLYQNTDVDFYAEADQGLAAQKEVLRSAKSFIFMEYHAIEDSTAFAGIKDILAERAAAGVEVRLIYDDIGSVGFINNDFIKRMEALGIHCRVFNPLIPILLVFMNNRDHRKVTVVDGKIGFTGGYNLANEYFGLTHPFGHWKDTGVRLEGDAVRSLTAMFLEMWNAISTTDTDYDRYLPTVAYTAKEQGFAQPYADSPLDEERLGENVYLNMIQSATDHIWFTTPYLIISDDMSRELGLAAKRGVDVRILTPGVPDKKMIYQVTRSYYAGLVRSGVRIWEYTPGFLHAKQCVCDGKAATVGTINLDFRSLYLHFENGLFFTGYRAVQQVEEDFVRTFAVSREVTADYSGPRSTVLRIGQCILRLFSPLM